MSRSSRLTVTVLALALALPGLAPAQSTTSGMIRGQVVDSQGGVLPGTTVIAISDALVAGRQTAVAGGNGGFRFPSLPPGTYDIEAHLQGFQSVRRSGVELRLGQTLEIELELSDVVISDEIVVVAEAVQVSTVSNTVSHNLTSEYLERQPLPRDTTELMNYTPGVNDQAAYGAPNSQASSYNLDGVDVSDPAGGSQWILPNFNWIEEVQVTGLGADAEYGGFTGAAVNLITKSGGNEFKGDVGVYYSDGSLTSGEQNNEVDSDWEVNFGIGGKLIQDKLWYFVSGEERQRTIDSFFVEEASFAPAAQIDQYEREFHRYLAKLTFQVSDGSKLVGMLDYDGLDTANANIGDFVLESAAYTQDSPNWAYNLSWESVVDESNFLQVKLTGFDGTNDSLPAAGSGTPARRDFFNSGLEWQNYQWTWLEDKSRLTLDATWSLFADGLITSDDSHNFKFGIEYESSTQDERRTRNGGFTYDDDSYYCGDTFAEQVANYFDDPFCGVFSSTRGGELMLDAVQQGWHAYAQDSWKTGRLTLNVGARYTAYEGGFDGGNESVYDVDMIAPRLGFVWDVTGSGTTAFKVHYGRYHEKLMAFMYDREESGDVFSNREFWDYNFDTGEFDIFFGERVIADAVLDPGISHPYVDQYVATVEHQLSDLWLVGADYVHRETEDMIAMVNTNLDYDFLVANVANPLSGGEFSFYELLSPPENLLTNPEAAYRDYDALMLRANRRYADRWTFNASLVWADMDGNTSDVDGYEPAWEDLNGLINNDGRPGNYSEWEGKVRATVDLPWDMVLSGYYLYRSGEYWTPYVTVRGLLENNNTTVNLLERGSEQLPDYSRFDLHLDKRFNISDKVALTLKLDVFNVLDEDTALAVSQRWGTFNYYYAIFPETDPEYGDNLFDMNPSYKTTTAVQDPREIRLGVQISF